LLSPFPSPPQPQMGMLKGAWWIGRISVFLSVVAFYGHYAVTKGVGTKCDKPLFLYVISEATVSLLHMILRTIVLLIGPTDDPSDCMRFLLLYPVVLHVAEVLASVWAMITILEPQDWSDGRSAGMGGGAMCDLAPSPPYVYCATLVCLATFATAGVVYPMMFDTRWKGLASDTLTLEQDPDASRHGAGRFLRDLHAFFLVYRMCSVTIMFITFLIVRDGESSGDFWPVCSTAPEVWVMIELLFYLVSYVCTLTYAVRALLYPLFGRLVTTHEKAMWMYVALQFVSGCVGIKLVDDGGDCGGDETSAVKYMVIAGVVFFCIFVVFSVCLAPYWRPWLVTRRAKAAAGQEKERRRQGRERSWEGVREWRERELQDSGAAVSAAPAAADRGGGMVAMDQY
jgi:hypothetical protein